MIGKWRRGEYVAGEYDPEKNEKKKLEAQDSVTETESTAPVTATFERSRVVTPASTVETQSLTVVTKSSKSMTKETETWRLGGERERPACPESMLRDLKKLKRKYINNIKIPQVL